jgi:hypothetical protein
MKIINLLVATSLLLVACNSKSAVKKEEVKDDTAKTTATADTSKPILTGADKDEHGCIGSAGYQWSVMKSECIRIFEAGTRLSAAAAVEDKTTDAFVVFSHDEKEAELFVPRLAVSVILESDKDNTWISAEWTKEKDWEIEKTEKGFVAKKNGIVQYAE